MVTLRFPISRQIPQRRVALRLRRKDDRSWRHSEDFARSIRTNESLSESLTILGNKCTITPPSRTLPTLTGVPCAKSVPQEHQVLTLKPSFLPALSGSRYMATAYGNLSLRSPDLLNLRTGKGQADRAVWIQQDRVNRFFLKQNHSPSTVRPLREERISFYGANGIAEDRYSSTLRKCSVGEKRGQHKTNAKTTADNKKLTSKYQSAFFLGNAWAMERKIDCMQEMNVASSIVISNVRAAESIYSSVIQLQDGKDTELTLPTILTSKKRK